MEYWIYGNTPSTSPSVLMTATTTPNQQKYPGMNEYTQNPSNIDSFYVFIDEVDDDITYYLSGHDIQPQYIQNNNNQCVSYYIKPEKEPIRFVVDIAKVRGVLYDTTKKPTTKPTPEPTQLAYENMGEIIIKG